jgi:opacity protein-like surface antigen
MKSIALAALLAALPCCAAKADWIVYAGNDFTINGFQAGHDAVTAQVTFERPLSKYLTGQFPGFVVIQVGVSGMKAQPGVRFMLSDGGNVFDSNSLPAGSDFFIDAFTTADGTAIDFTKGWVLGMNWTTPAGSKFTMGTSSVGTSPTVFGGTQDISYQLIGGTVTNSYNNNTPGAWAER